MIERNETRPSVAIEKPIFQIDSDTLVFKELLITEGKRGLVLDIDETLSNTVLHWMKEMQKRFGNPEELSAEAMVEKYSYAQLVPYWQSNELAQVWMHRARESNVLQALLPVVEGAPEGVNAVNDSIPIIGYVTARPKDVIFGTQIWLDTYGFPQAPILARPDHIPVEDAPAWKAGVIHYLYPQVQGIVDDHPEFVRYLPSDYQGTVFHLGGTEVSRSDIAVIPCPIWPDAVTQAKLRFTA